MRYFTSLSTWDSFMSAIVFRHFVAILVAGNSVVGRFGQQVEACQRRLNFYPLSPVEF